MSSVPNSTASSWINRHTLTCLNHLIIGLFQFSMNVLTFVYIDFREALYTTIHSKLFDKLVAHGISGSLLHWIINFLDKSTSLNSSRHITSSMDELSSGIVQGNDSVVSLCSRSLKTRFFGLHFCRKKYQCIFNHFCVIRSVSYRIR